MCYRPKETKNNKSKQFFIDLIPELESYTTQLAIGGGEPLLDQSFVQQLGKTITDNDMIMNVTTNGTIGIEEETAKYIEMISVSLDKYKRPTKRNFMHFAGYVYGLKEIYDLRVGVNLLLEDFLLFPPKNLVDLVDQLFNSLGVERVFALSPKNWPMAHILEQKEALIALSTIYEHFYVDELTEKIITENNYWQWKTPCHYGTKMLSIDEQGNVKGCSFADNILLHLEEPEDIHKIKDIDIEERYACPYLQQEEK